MRTNFAIDMGKKSFKTRYNIFAIANDRMWQAGYNQTNSAAKSLISLWPENINKLSLVLM